MIGKKTGWFTSLGLVLGLGMAMQAYANDNWNGRYDKLDTYSLSDSDFHLDPGEMETINLSGWRYVKKIYVRAAGASNIDGTFEVVANGDIKGTIYVPGKDPLYVVTIGEVIRSLQFRHVSGGKARIFNVKATMSDRVQKIRPIENDIFANDSICCGGNAEAPLDHFPAGNLASKVARRAITLVDKLEGFANYKEYGVYLLPIKKSAGRAYAVSTARGVLSRVTRQSLLVLKRQIEFACPYLDEAFERDHVFNLAVELMSLGEQINELLD